MPDLNEILFRAFNSLAGRSWVIDSFVALTTANDLIKSAPVGACFFAAWYGGTTLSATLAARRTLLVTLVAAFLTLGTTTALSHAVLSPRPYLRAHKIYQLRDRQLEALPRVAFRVPLDNRARQRELAFQTGDIPPTDLASFPSDHAGFFGCLALGTFLASRRIGGIALAWTFLVILSGKVIPGMHMPFEVAAGCLIAVAWLITCCYVTQTRLERISTQLTTWTTQHAALAAALLFLAIFEVASTLDHVTALLTPVVKHV